MDELVEGLKERRLLVDELAVTAAWDSQDLGRLETDLDLAFGFDHGVAAHSRCGRHGTLVAGAEHL
jgi:hypothetical protein